MNKESGGNRARDYRLKTIENQPPISQKSPQVVKQVVKCEKRACSTPGAGKNKPILYSAKIRDFFIPLRHITVYKLLYFTLERYPSGVSPVWYL
jgi:hypothetical protein